MRKVTKNRIPGQSELFTKKEEEVQLIGFRERFICTNVVRNFFKLAHFYTNFRKLTFVISRASQTRFNSLYLLSEGDT